MSYRPDIDGLRAVAVLLVVVFHAFPTLVPGGFIGVDVFFVISGYLISLNIISELQAGHFRVANFYRRRVRRIFPALILIMVASLLLGWFALFADEYKQLGKHVAAGATFRSNFVLWKESGYFDEAAEAKPMLHLWSLAVEEQFYIFWPLLLGFLFKRNWSFLKAFAVVGLLSFGVNAYLARTNAVADFYSPIARFWELAAGGGLAFVSIHKPHWVAQGKNARSLLGFALLVLGMVLVHKGRAFPGWWALLPVAGAFFIMSAGPQAWLNKFFLGNKGVVWVGLISYPLYLWHWPVLSYLHIVMGEEIDWPDLVVALAVTFALAWATYFFIEKKLRHSQARLTVPLLSTAFVALFAMSMVISSNNGFAGRAINRQFDGATHEDVFAASRRSDGSCESRLGLTGLPEEICLASSGSPQVLFAGDSHAMAVYSAIHAGQHALDAMLVAGHACPSYPGLVYTPSHEHDYGNNCTDIAKKALDVAERLKSIHTVVLVNTVPAIDDLPSRYRADAKMLSNRDAFLVGESAMIAALLKQDKKVIFMVDVPHLKHDPRSCVRRLPFVTPPSCGYTVAEHNERRKAYLDQIRQLKSAYPGLIVFDPMGFFCQGETCATKDEVGDFYNDSHHLSVHASDMLLRKMREEKVLSLQ